MLRFSIAVLAVLSACGDDGAAEDVEPVASTCPPELTYALAAEPVLQTYCVMCHGAQTADKLGEGNVIDSEARIREHGSGLYDLVWRGDMPKAGGPIPDAQKHDFLDWMECSGATAMGHDHTH